MNASPFCDANLEETKAQLKKLKLEICCLSSGCALRFADKRDENIEELKKYIALAKELGTPCIRVLGDLTAEPTTDFDDMNVIEPMRILAPIAEEAGVMLLIETNGVYSDTARLADVLAQIASDNVAALWDFNHPYRFNGETPETTIKNLGMFIKHVHIKDSVTVDGKTSYRLMGEGDMPIDKMMFALTSINYEGFVSFEWIPSWIEEIGDAGIVFPHFINYMSRFDTEASQTQLYDNKTKTGKFIWKKESLINLTNI